jgi:transposase-like protein
MLHEQEPSYASRWAALTSIAGKIGCTPETLRKWVKRAEIDEGRRAGRTTSGLAPLSRTHLKRPIMAREECHAKTKEILGGVQT